MPLIAEVETGRHQLHRPQRRGHHRTAHQLLLRQHCAGRSWHMAEHPPVGRLVEFENGHVRVPGERFVQRPMPTWIWGTAGSDQRQLVLPVATTIFAGEKS